MRDEMRVSAKGDPIVSSIVDLPLSLSFLVLSRLQRTGEKSNVDASAMIQIPVER